MIRLLFVGDSKRDAATNPHLVAGITGADIEPTAIPWPRLNQSRGYEKKLLFAIRQARREGLQGVVATVDQDKSDRNDRFDALASARVRDRERDPALPTAIGCAVPHAEAWLLDDATAVRLALQLEDSTAVPGVIRVKSPKDELDRLHRQGVRADDPATMVLADIAKRLDPLRCAHARQTGFAQFALEVRNEIGPLAAA